MAFYPDPDGDEADDLEAALLGFLEDAEDEDGDVSDVIDIIADQLGTPEDPAPDDEED